MVSAPWAGVLSLVHAPSICGGLASGLYRAPCSMVPSLAPAVDMHPVAVSHSRRHFWTRSGPRPAMAIRPPERWTTCGPAWRSCDVHTCTCDATAVSERCCTHRHRRGHRSGHQAREPGQETERVGRVAHCGCGGPDGAAERANAMDDAPVSTVHTVSALRGLRPHIVHRPVRRRRAPCGARVAAVARARDVPCWRRWGRLGRSGERFVHSDRKSVV